jgi:hypothetical protein
LKTSRIAVCIGCDAGISHVSWIELAFRLSEASWRPGPTGGPRSGLGGLLCSDLSSGRSNRQMRGKRDLRSEPNAVHDKTSSRMDLRFADNFGANMDDTIHQGPRIVRLGPRQADCRPRKIGFEAHSRSVIRVHGRGFNPAFPKERKSRDPRAQGGVRCCPGNLDVCDLCDALGAEPILPPRRVLKSGR